MKKKIAMRVASLALCVVFTGMLFGAPKSKAVATEVAVGTAAVASYFQATGLTMAASAGSTGALITTGVADIAGSYAMATGAASSGSAFLSSLAAGVSISSAGAIVLTAAAVVAIGALVAWYVAENNITAGEKVVISSVLGDSPYGFLLSDGSVYPVSYSAGGTSFVKCNEVLLSDFGYAQSRFFTSVSGGYVYYYILNSMGSPYAYAFWGLSDSGENNKSLSVYKEIRHIDSLGAVSVSFVYETISDAFFIYFLDNAGAVVEKLELAASSFFSDFCVNASEFSIQCSPDFTQPDVEFDTESQKQMVIDAGFPAGTTLDTVAEQVPELIAAGTLTPTYEITTTDTGEDTGNGTETQPDEETGIYIPVLSDIKTRLSTLGDTIVDGIMDGLTSLFVPSEAYLEALPEQITDTFEERTGFLTYPFSLLPDFVDRLSESSGDWILRWPQIVEPFTNTVLFQQGSFNVSSFIRSNAEMGKLYELYRLLAKVFMSFGFLSLCYNKYRSVVGDDYGGL